MNAKVHHVKTEAPAMTKSINSFVLALPASPGHSVRQVKVFYESKLIVNTQIGPAESDKSLNKPPSVNYREIPRLRIAPNML